MEISKILTFLRNSFGNKDKRPTYPIGKKSTVFVTGDLGKIGSLVTKKLSKKYNIIGYDLAASPSEDIDNYENLKSKMAGADYIVHLAGIPHPGAGDINAYFNSNVQGTLNVLNASKENNIKKFIYLSSTAYYGFDTRGKLSPKYLPIDESYPIPSTESSFSGELDEYGQSKIMAEQLCAYFGSNKFFEVVVLRSGPANNANDQYPKGFNWKTCTSYQRGAFWVNNDPDNIPIVVDAVLKSKKKYYYEPFNVVNLKTYKEIPVAEFVKKEYPKMEVRISLKNNPSLVDTRKLQKHFGKILK